MKTLKRLFTPKPQKTKPKSKGKSPQGTRSIYPSDDEMNNVISKSIREIGPVLKRLSNE